MPLKFYNTLSKTKETFTPLDKKRVRMYVCGPTVYDFAHIGNARPAVVFDVLFRLLRQTYGENAVEYAHNITDIDDKIIAAHQKTGTPIEEITEKFTAAYREDMAALGCLEPTHQPFATQTIPQMMTMVKALIKKGYAYEAQGHVVFSVPSMADYGKLSGNARDQVEAGARVKVASYKKDPADFVLWKPSSDDQPGWDSPWGRGRPGWHLECSAMIEDLFGDTIDIHGGGLDLIFPHHENEIAQSTCAHGVPLANVWMHNGYLTVEGEKMSKSLGNFFTVRELLEKGIRGEVIRYVLLSAHYRQPMDWSKEAVNKARTNLDRFYRALSVTKDVQVEAFDRLPLEIEAALQDDLNTPKAMAALHQYANAIMQGNDVKENRGKLMAAAHVLGILQQDPQSWFQAGNIEAEVEDLIKAREQARADKDFIKADKLRAQLEAMGIVLEDSPAGTTWKRA